MAKDSNRFTLTLSLPRNTMVNYMFWVPIDNNKDSTDGWDNFGEIFYATYFSENRKILIDDHALYMPGDNIPLNGLSSAKYILCLLALLSIVLMITFRKRLSYSTIGFFQE